MSVPSLLFEASACLQCCTYALNLSPSRANHHGIPRLAIEVVALLASVALLGLVLGVGIGKVSLGTANDYSHPGEQPFTMYNVLTVCPCIQAHQGPETEESNLQDQTDGQPGPSIPGGPGRYRGRVQHATGYPVPR